jgi:hypothetical protein
MSHCVQQVTGTLLRGDNLTGLQATLRVKTITASYIEAQNRYQASLDRLVEARLWSSGAEARPASHSAQHLIGKCALLSQQPTTNNTI